VQTLLLLAVCCLLLAAVCFACEDDGEYGKTPQETSKSTEELRQKIAACDLHHPTQSRSHTQTRDPPKTMPGQWGHGKKRKKRRRTPAINIHEYTK
jgi:hypothetical protein